MVLRVLKLETDIHGMDRPSSVRNMYEMILQRLRPLKIFFELGHDTSASLIISISAWHME
jgi:hypothetical protein